MGSNGWLKADRQLPGIGSSTDIWNEASPQVAMRNVDKQRPWRFHDVIPCGIIRDEVTTDPSARTGANAGTAADRDGRKGRPSIDGR